VHPLAIHTTATTTFVLRFFYETTAGEVRWRGSIKHVQSGEETAFLDIETLFDFLHRYGIHFGGCVRMTPE
jgi:hypothetical protein